MVVVVAAGAVRHLAERLSTYALDYVSPERCVACAAPGRWLCRSCLLALGPPPPLACPGCGRASEHGLACTLCLQLDSPLAQLIVSFSYERTGFHKLLWSYKERGARYVLPYLAGRLRQVSREHVPALNVGSAGVTFVPAAAQRVRERGFDQARLLAEAVGSELHLPVAQLLTRTRSGAAQKTLDVLGRRTALRHAYRVSGAEVPATVVLVDDVATTLATLETCAARLREAGADTVVGLVLAHAQQRRDER